MYGRTGCVLLVGRCEIVICFLNPPPHSQGYGVTRWRSWLRHCATNRKVAGSIPDGVTGIFLWHSFRPHYGPGFDSASNRNGYQKYFLGGKGGRCLGLTTLPPSCADCLEIWEPHSPGTLRACNGIACFLKGTVVHSRACTNAELGRGGTWVETILGSSKCPAYEDLRWQEICAEN